MSNSLAIAASGLKSQEYLIGKVANDLANLNTANYKSSKIIFADMVYEDLNKANDHPKLGLGSMVYKTTKDFASGPLKLTGNWNDLAIDGEGFFQIVNKDGDLLYTRNSSFTVDEDHYLCTQEGFRLADNIQIPEVFQGITVDKNGDVFAQLSEETEPQLLGTINLAKFINPESLDLLANGIYKKTEQTGEPILDLPGSSGIGILAQNSIEGSNVNMVDSLMQLTFAQRVYQLNAKAMQVADEIEKLTNEIIP